MGRGKHCSIEKREIINKLLDEGKTFAFIRHTLGVSNGMITNAKNWSFQSENRGRRRKTNQIEDRAIIRITKQRCFITSTQIKTELNLPVSTSMIRKRLIAADLNARRPRKVPLLKPVHLKRRIQFAKKFIHEPETVWRNILWTDETKVVQFDHGNEKQYVRRPPKQEFNAKFTAKTVKHGGLKLMLWGCFSWNGVGPLIKISGIMDAKYYVENILEGVMLPYAEEEMPLRWVFQQDNDPKHTSKKAKNWFRAKKLHVLEWPAQSPDLYPIEHLWMDVKKGVREAKPTNSEELWQAAKKSWENIPLLGCRALISSMSSRCSEVIKYKGGATSY